ncbi:hypothetical protein CN481_04690 [Bacillus sp. AFS006103]|nr:hypothetical protein CN481_04690 [Bacillus sp. AFS006103]
MINHPWIMGTVLLTFYWLLRIWLFMRYQVWYKKVEVIVFLNTFSLCNKKAYLLALPPGGSQ